jgi:ribonuclease HI
MELLRGHTKRVDLTARGYVRGGGRPGAGWACILRHDKHRKCLTGSAASRSEWRMEVLALVSGLKALKYACEVNLHTGTHYVSDSASELIRGRRSSQFVASVAAGTANNSDLWREFRLLAEQHRITVVWVGARSRHPDDSAARMAARWAA